MQNFLKSYQVYHKQLNRMVERKRKFGIRCMKRTVDSRTVEQEFNTEDRLLNIPVYRYSTTLE